MAFNSLYGDTIIMVIAAINTFTMFYHNKGVNPFNASSGLRGRNLKSNCVI